MKKARQKEAILRYVDEFETITNAEARQLLQLPSTASSYVSRLFQKMVEEGTIEKIRGDRNASVKYRKSLYGVCRFLKVVCKPTLNT